MLTFLLYFLIKNPEAMRKLREEIDGAIGRRSMTVDDVHKLPYLIGKRIIVSVKIFISTKISCHARDPSSCTIGPVSFRYSS